MDWLIVGLGNPGPKYERTRHNVGFAVIDELLDRAGNPTLKSKHNALFAETRLGGHQVALVKPMTYMNESGRAVGALARWYKLGPGQIIVVQDELDLAPGALKVKDGGGLAGHNGLRSIAAHLSSSDFVRVRIGVGKPPGGKERGVSHVLAAFSKVEQTEMTATLLAAADACECIVDYGVDRAMSDFNGRV